MTPQRSRRAAVTVRLSHDELRRVADLAAKVHRVGLASTLELATTLEMLALKGLLACEREFEEQLCLEDAAHLVARPDGL